MARRSQCSSSGDNPLDPNYLPPHYREEYRLAVDALVEEDLEGYYKFLQFADVVDFLSTPEIQYIQDSVQVPHQSHHPEQHFLETGEDGSSDTYWPIHSDLDVPGLDLGWPQLHHFVGPTEITTLVSPPEPDMPSIKEQARRLIKNAQQVIAVVMDIFTDVDIFADILNAAMRNVAVYIILDEQNTHHFVNMVTNCRVDLQSLQFLRVRTVSGVTYQCRSGKTMKGQMMNRFLLTDCRAVLSGNYSFMWSFEKLHRSMAHLFLGQLVSTFDEEFRILFAQSQPLMLDKMHAPMEDFGSQKRQHISERTALYREPRKFLPLDTGHPEERTRHSFDDRMDVDWRLMPLKRQEAPQGPSDVYGRYSPQQPRMDPPYDQGPSRITMLDNPAFKRHSYAEGVQGRFSHPFLQQQGVQEPENQGRQFHRGPIPGPEADYSGYDKFWNQDFNSADQHSEPVISQEIQPPDGFDPVLNYLASTRNFDSDQSSDKLLPSADLPFSSPHHRRQSLGQPYVYQTSPTPSNRSDQKQFSQKPSTDRKDPSVKRGLRSWRISSYLSACDNPGDDGLPMATPQGPDPFEETSNPVQQTSTGVDLTFPKIPNVREFKVPTIPRASQMPSYIKATVREKPKKVPDEPSAVAAETRTTPTSSESSSTAEVEKAEEVELKEPKPTPLLREESFRRIYNAATPRSSRLRSSLIFSSLDQQRAPQDPKTAQGQQEEESDKNEAEQTKLPFVSQVLGKRRTAAREPFEWSRYMKSNTIDNSATEASKTEDGNSKADDKDPSKVEDSKDISENSAVLEPPEAELPKPDLPAQTPKSVLSTSSYIDMNDPDARLMFFKELAAKRKAEKAAEAEKSNEKAQMNPTDLKNKTPVKKEEPGPKVAPEKMTNTSSSEGVSEKNVTADDAGKTVSAQECESSVSLSLEASDGTKKQDSLVEKDPSTFQSCKEEQKGVSTDSKKKEPQISTPASSSLDSAETESSLEDSKLSKPAVTESSLSNPAASTNSAPADVSSPFTSKESSSLTPSSVEVSDALDSKTQVPESVQVSPAPLSKQPTESEMSSSHPSVQSSSSDPVLSDSGAQIRPSPPTSISAPLSTPEKSLCSDVTQEDSDSTPKSSILSPNPDKLEELESVSSSETVKESTAESTASESVESVSPLTSSENPSAVDSANLESEISPDTCTAGVEAATSSLTSTTETNSKESCAPTPPEKDVGKSESAAEKTEVLASPEDVKSDIASPSPSPLSPKSALPNVADLNSSTSTPDQIKTITLNLLHDTPSETCSPVKPDITADASQSTSKASPQDAPTQATPPSELNLTGSVTPTPVETASPSSPLSESVGAVLSPEAEKAETNISSCSPTDTLFLPKQVATDSNDSAEASSPTEPTSDILTEPEPTPASVTSDSQASEPPEPAEDSKLDQQREISKDSGSLPDPGENKPENVEAKNKINKDITQESVKSEKINEQLSQNICPENTSTEAVPPSQQSKQPKTSQSRYQSSTANVLASSNLRDDTKLLLGQISANSQSRNEATKEAPVTDDEKEDEADKNAKREKERGSLSRTQPKSTQEKEKLLERIQSMRKERKVYSRFEMAP